MNWSVRITEYMISDNTICEDDRSLYIYAFSRIFSSLVSFIIVITIGIMTHCIKNTVIIMLTFWTMRRYSGGFHLKQPVLCMISSVFVLYGTVLISVYMDSSICYAIGFFISCIAIFFLSPVEHSNNPLNSEERNRYRKIARVLTGFIIIVCAVLSMFDAESELKSILIGYILCAVLQSLAAIISHISNTKNFKFINKKGFKL